MDLTIELSNKIHRLDEHSQHLILGIVNKILIHDDFDNLTDEDFKNIQIAEQEISAGEYHTWNEVL